MFEYEDEELKPCHFAHGAYIRGVTGVKASITDNPIAGVTARWLSGVPPWCGGAWSPGAWQSEQF